MSVRHIDFTARAKAERELAALLAFPEASPTDVEGAHQLWFEVDTGKMHLLRFQRGRWVEFLRWDQRANDDAANMKRHAAWKLRDKIAQAQCEHVFTTPDGRPRDYCTVTDSKGHRCEFPKPRTTCGKEPDRWAWKEGGPRRRPVCRRRINHEGRCGWDDGTALPGAVRAERTALVVKLDELHAKKVDIEPRQT